MSILADEVGEIDAVDVDRVVAHLLETRLFDADGSATADEVGGVGKAGEVSPRLRGTGDTGAVRQGDVFATLDEETHAV